MMFFPYRILFIGCLAVQAELLSRAFVQKIWPRDNRAGLYLGSSCKPYDATLAQAFTSINEVAKAGYNQALYQDRFFHWFFEPYQQLRVVEVLKNIVIATNGHGPTVRFTCETKTSCTTTPAALWSLAGSEYINVCPKALSGDQALIIVRDYCKPPRRVRTTLTSVIFHEMIHSTAIGGSPRIVDYAETLRGCMQLGEGLAKDQNGNKTEATSNVNNYVLLAEYSMWKNEQGDPTACVNTGGGRTLTGFNDTDDTSGYDTDEPPQYGITPVNATTSAGSLTAPDVTDQSNVNATDFLAFVGDYSLYPASENQSVAANFTGGPLSPVVVQNPPDSQDIIQGN